MPETDGSAASPVASRRSRLPAPLEAAAFWLAVVLPFLYGPLLVVGLDSPGVRRAFAALLVLDVLALVAGHGYRGPGHRQWARGRVPVRPAGQH